MTRKEIVIKGMVQGVGWRYHCLKITERFKIDGYVKNMSDGSVKIVVEGPEEIVEEFIQYLKFSNYPGSVKEWQITNSAYTGEFKGFKIKY